MTKNETAGGDVNLCFVICPIGEAGTPIRERSDKVFRFLIRHVCELLGLRAERADHIQQSGMITTQVIQRILNAPFVIADLTDHNANVFYELAIRHASGKPFVQLIEKGYDLPFDIAGMRTIVVAHNDVESMEAARVQLREQLERAPERLDTPISVAIDIEALKAGNPLARSVAEVQTAIGDVRSELSAVNKYLGNSEYSTRVAMEELRSMTTTLFARLSGVVDPNVLSALVDVTQILTRAKKVTTGDEALSLLDDAEHRLRRLALRLMGSESPQAPSARRERKTRSRRR